MKATAPHWKYVQLLACAITWFGKLHKQKKLASEHNALWWHFAFKWRASLESIVRAFIAGQYRFGPMIQYQMPGETVLMWDYPDRLVTSLLLTSIKSTFKQIISATCMHLRGPNGVRESIASIQTAMNHQPYRYVMRLDIKGYYASIDRKILFEQIKQHYDDARVIDTFKQVIFHAIDNGGNVTVPEKGIPRRSSLSPFLGALYLSPIDRAFENRQGIFYVRYMDDFIIMAQTKAQYVRARKILFKLLRSLKLKLSPRKSRMGRLMDGFHFLGANFQVSRNIWQKNQAVTITMHDRSCRRALDKVQTMTQDAVNPATRQRYIMQWAAWWALALSQKESLYTYINHWIKFCLGQNTVPRDITLLGLGLLIKQTFT